MQTKFAELIKQRVENIIHHPDNSGGLGRLCTVHYETSKARVLVHPMTTVAPNTSLLLAWSIIFIFFLASSTKTLVFYNSCSRLKTIPCFSLSSRLYSGWPRLRGTRSSGKSDLSQLVDFWIFINKVVKHCTCFICNLVCYNILCLNHPQFH